MTKFGRKIDDHQAALYYFYLSWLRNEIKESPFALGFNGRWFFIYIYDNST